MTCLFAGNPDSLAIAYPEDLRSQISNRAEILPYGFSNGEWEGLDPAARRASVIFGTWGLPRMDAEFLEAFPNLQAVFYAAGSVKGFAAPELFERGVKIFSAWSANAIPVAEYTLATVILSLKRVWAYTAQTSTERNFHRLIPIPGCYRSKVGLVSLGAIGKLVAEKLQSMDLEVLGFDPFVKEEDAARLGVRMVSLEKLFATADVVSLHTPWIPETVKMIHAPLLRSMKEGATLINTSRGAVIDEADLCEVLAERRDLTAILDVTYPEPPPPESPLHQLSNVILTPHIAGSMGGEITRMGAWMTEEFFRFLDGTPPRWEITSDMLSKMA